MIAVMSWYFYLYDIKLWAIERGILKLSHQETIRAGYKDLIQEYILEFPHVGTKKRGLKKELFG